MTRRKLPIGMQTFRDIREGNCYYVDKTAYVGRLLDEGKHYFLSRPRRFGKSLFLDTCKELFEGNEPLFEGLDGATRCPRGTARRRFPLRHGRGAFRYLVRMSSARAGQRAVVLVDEYDKPILDALDVPEVARAKYRERGEPIHLIAVEFSRESRNLAAFDVEQA